MIDICQGLVVKGEDLEPRGCEFLILALDTWWDISRAGYYIEESEEIKIVKWGTPKNIKKQNIFQIVKF